MASNDRYQNFIIHNETSSKRRKVDEDSLYVFLKEMGLELKKLDSVKALDDPIVLKTLKSAAPTIKHLNKILNGEDDDSSDQEDEKEEPFEPFDWKLYSALVRKARKEDGFKTADAFSAAIYRRTRITVSRDTIYKIEQGKQIPDPVQFFGINYTLYEEFMPRQIVDLCFDKQLLGAVAPEAEDFPRKWAIENFTAAAGDRANDPEFDPALLAAELGEPPYLFKNPHRKPQKPQTVASATIYDEDIPF